MDEASSKFVDNLALERLLADKLSKVSHSPVSSRFVPEVQLFDHFDKTCRLEITEVHRRADQNNQWFEFPSLQLTAPYPENNTVYLRDYPATAATGNILLVHGLFDDNIFNYAFLIRLFHEMNLNVFLMILPYHHERKPAVSFYSGEYFFSADIYRTQNAFKQAVYDLEACLQLIRHQNPLPVMVTGFSMGGAVAFRHYLATHQATGTFLINPVTDLLQVIWDNPLLVTIRRDLETNGIDQSTCATVFRELDPCENLTPELDLHNIAVGYSRFDQIVALRNNERFVQRSGIKNVTVYHAGHLNILRVPKLAADIQAFFGRVVIPT